MGDIHDELIDLRALAKANDPRAVAAVLPLLGEDTEVEIKRAIVRRIGRLRGHVAEEVLATIAERDALAEIRVKAAKALSALDRERGVDFLLAELSADEGFVRENAIRALEADETLEVREAIRQVLRDDTDQGVRVVAAEALATMRYMPAIPDVEAAYKSARGVHRWVLRGYLRSLQRRSQSE